MRKGCSILRGGSRIAAVFSFLLSFVAASVRADTVATPTFSPTSSTSYVQFNVTVTDATNGATIYYTLDGSTPTTSSATVASGGAVLISKTETLKAYAVAGGYTDSAVASASYEVTGQVSAGWYHTIALRADGTVWTWGVNSSGQCGLGGSSASVFTPAQVTGLSGIIEVAAGAYHSVALKGDGTVWAWGLNSNGQLGDNTTTSRTSPVQVKTSNGSGGTTALTNIVAIAAGAYHCLALDSAGNVWAWGLNSSGQLGDGSLTQRNLAVELTGITGTILGAGSYQSFVVTAGGAVEAWGNNNTNQLGDGTTVNRSSPVVVSGLSGVSIVGFAGNDNNSLALQSDGTVWQWGNDNHQSAPAHLTTVSGVVQVASAADSFSVVKSDGTVRSWGGNTYGHLGNGSSLSYYSTPITPSISDVVATSMGIYHTVFVQSDGSVRSSAWNVSDQMGIGIATAQLTPVQILTSSTWKAIGSGDTMMIRADGTVWGLGENGGGCLGNGNALQTITPVQASGLTNMVSVSGNYQNTSQTMALKSDGTIWAFGYNGSGQLGAGANPPPFVPVQTGTSVPSFTNLVAVTTSAASGYALKSDGTVWAWGDNTSGDLGIGNTTARNTPVQVPSLSGVTALSGGGYAYFLALKNDGTVWACGSNAWGELGDGTTTDRWTPVEVLTAASTPLTNIVQIQANLYVSTALDSSGHVWAWGRGGWIGDGTTTERHYAVQLTGISGVRDLGYSTENTFAFKNDGTLWGWGNSSAALGLGINMTVSSPTLLTKFPGVVSIRGNEFNSLLLKEDGHIEVAGIEAYGRMGLIANRTPQLLPGFNTIAATLPAVSITAPANNTTCVLGGTKTLTATETETGGTIASVSYYDRSILIGTSTDSGSNYSVSWTPTTWGVYALDAIATDTNGHASFRSATVNVTVPYDSDSNSLPDWWELKYFSTLGNSASSSPTGKIPTLLQDYQQGNDPTNYYSQGGTIITPTLTIVSGNNQISSPGQTTAYPLVLGISNGGTPLVNAPVTFNVTTGGGLLSATLAGGGSSSFDTVTDASGHAQVFYQNPAVSSTTSTIGAITGTQSTSFSASTSIGDGTFDAMSNLTATYPSLTEVDLTWINNASTATGILIEQSTDNVVWTTTAVLINPAATSYAVTGLTSGQTYNFRVAPTK